MWKKEGVADVQGDKRPGKVCVREGGKVVEREKSGSVA